ncbi:hypothetical protein B4129_2412 [Bacillus safensis]|nr:hypothetical protein B4129_2412 [Bacillus safensis]
MFRPLPISSNVCEGGIVCVCTMKKSSFSKKSCFCSSLFYVCGFFAVLGGQEAC